MFGLILTLSLILFTIPTARSLTTYPYPAASILNVPNITSISTDSASNSGNTGSIAGGNSLYIRGSGLTSDLRKLTVFIGQNICPINLAYTSDFQVACTVPEVLQSGTVPIKVFLSGIQGECPGDVCQYTYSVEATPQLNQIAPVAVIAAKSFKILGSWFGTDSRQVQVTLNGAFCSKVVSTLTPDTTQCYPDGFTAGRYSININVPKYGVGSKTGSAKILATETYASSDFIILPEITRLSSNNGPTTGQTITIIGKGFSSNIADNEVLYEEQYCNVISSSYDSIQCILTTPPFRTAGRPRPGHGGIVHRIYPLTSSFEELKKRIPYITRYSASADSYGRLASSEVEFERPVPLQTEVIEGYFKAPKTGSYKFMLSAAGSAELYISTTPLVDEANQKIAQATGSNFRDFFTQASQISAGINLIEGNYYFFQAYHITAHTNYLTIGVRIPSTERTEFSPREVVSVKINAQVERLEILITLRSTTEGIKLTLGDEESEALTYPPLDYQVEKAFLDIGLEAKVLNIVFQNADGEEVDQANAVKTQYTVRLYTQPNFATLPELSNESLGNIVRVPGNSPSSLVSGSFELAFNGVTISLDYDSTTGEVQNAFNDALGVDFATRVFRNGRVEEGSEFIIYFDGIADDVSEIRLKSSTITGGKTTPTITINVLQDAGSNDIVLPVIPPELLRTYETIPQITVRTNGILASCTGSCRYEAAVGTSWPTITAFTRDGGNLEIALINSATHVAADFDRVTFGGNTATVTSFDSTSQVLKCTIPANSDGSVRIVAGNHVPQVRVKLVGYALISSDITNLKVTPTITKITPVELANGLVEITLEGTGFGFSLTDRFDTTITISGISCSLTSLSNTKAICRANIIITQGPLTLTVNNISVQSPFTFSKTLPAKEITNKCDLDITGTGFTDATFINLINSDHTVVEKCRACVRSSTLIRCNTCDLPAGDYTAVINYGASSTTPQSGVTFKIEHNVVSIVPSTGSLLGGTVITITGAGFSETLTDNEVSITAADSEYKLLCEILTATKTQLTCKVPFNSAEFEGVTTVTVKKGDNQAICSGDCTFTFTAASTPTITSASSLTIKPGQQITVQGTLISATTQFMFGGLIATVVSNTPTSATIIIPNVVASYPVAFVVTNPATGIFAVDASVVFGSLLKLSDVTPKTGSQGGTIITLTGEGFSSQTQVLVGTNACAIITSTLTQITCKTVGSDGDIKVTQGAYSDVTCGGCSFTTNAASTPVITSVAVDNTTPGSVKITIQGTQLNIATPLAVSLKNGDTVLAATVSSSSATSIVATLSNPTAGKYTLEVKFGNHFAKYENSPSLEVIVPFTQTASSTSKITVSQAGGRALTLSFQGNPLPLEQEALNVKIAGFDCPITANTATSITCVIPPLSVSEASPLAEEGLIKGDLIASASSLSPGLAFDESITSSWQGENECFIGLDVGAELRAALSLIEFYPKASIDPSNLQNGMFEGSNDGTTFTDIVSVAENVYQGWNTIQVDTATVGSYRWIRYRQAGATSRCEFSELRFKGILVSSLQVTDADVVAVTTATVTVQDLTISTIVTDIEYRADTTPTVTEITPNVGTSAGGTTVTIKGDHYSTVTSQIKVTIDGVACQVKTADVKVITCTTGALPAVQDRTGRLTGKVEVTVEGKGTSVATGISFLYAEKWSDIKTWGCDGFPLEGDSVHIPEGMNLLVDISPPKVNAVVVEGGLYFEDKEINFGCEYLMVRGGVLRIGTEQTPVTNKIIITLYGSHKDPQLPIFGNKVIGAYEGTIDIHGTSRGLLETTLAVTSKIGDSQITVEDASGFQVGDTIVISTTSQNPLENEKRKIIKIADQKITLDSRLSYVHLAEEEAIQFEGTPQTVQVKAIIVLLTRNIVIQGDATSDVFSYGAHLLFNDPSTDNTVVRISNVEIRNAGQGGYVDKYPINFQNAGNQVKSYITGCSIHSSYNKGIQVKGTQYLEVSNNIFYNIRGEAIILPDGVEKFNEIQSNVIVQISEDLFSFSGMHAKAVKIANPLNFVNKNTVVGAVYGGFHLAFPATAQGAAFGQTVCPQGERLGSFAENYVLASTNAALTIDAHYPRTFACQAARTTGADPYAANPPVTATYRKLIVIRNDRGLVAKSIGAVIFDGFKISDDWIGSIDINAVANAPIGSAQLKNSLLVGRLHLTNGGLDVISSAGILIPESEGFILDNILFAHLSVSTPAIHTIPASTSKTTIVKNLKFLDVLSRVDIYRHIIKDTDGSLAGSGTSGTVVYDFPHIRVPECTSNALLSGVRVCDSAVEVRGLNLANFPQRTIHILRLEEGVNPETVENSKITSITYTASQGIPFVTGYPYRISFGSAVEIVGGRIDISALCTAEDLPFTLGFKNGGSQYDFIVTKRTYPNTDSNGTNSTASFDIFDRESLVDNSFGDFHHDFATKTLYIAVTGKGMQAVSDAADVTTATISAYTKPADSTNPTDPGNSTDPTDPTDPTPNPVLDYRLWSDATKWPNQAKPAAGADVVIGASDTVLLDEDSPALNSLRVLGTLILGNNQTSSTLTAKRILVRGRLIAGNATNAFIGQARIRLTGTKADTGFTDITSAVTTGPKVLVVTGEVSLYGKAVSTLLRLTANAAAGATQITVDGDISQFSVGDQILIAPSRATAGESEVKTIQQINTATKTLTLTTGLQYFHYGSAASLTVSNGMTVDMRTEVLHITRNIKIEGTEEDQLGARILVTRETVDTTTKIGVINMKYVSLSYCGRADTPRAALAFDTTSAVTATSTVYGTVFLNSVALVTSFNQAGKVNFEHNTIYKAKQHGIRFYASNTAIKVANNAIIEVDQTSSSTLLESSAGILAVDETNTNIQIQNNIVAGCAFSCYFIRPPICTVATSFFTGNIAHSGKFGYVAYSDRKDCILLSRFTAYRMEYGVITDNPSIEIQAANLALADNGVSLNLVNNGNGSPIVSDKYPTALFDGVRTITIKDSHFAGVALPSCTQCYSQASTCSNRYAIGLNRLTDLVRDTIQTATRLTALGSKYVISSNHFENFSNGLVTGCVNNKVFFVSKQARDFIPLIKTDSNTITNVNEDSLALFQTPNTGDNNCGPGGECTLEMNTLIQDNDGLLTSSASKPTVLLPNNPGVVDTTKCTVHTAINGYICKGQKYNLMSMNVMDNDKFSTTLSPVVISKTGFTNSVNSHRANTVSTASDTQKFISLVQSEGTYDVKFPGSIPREIVFELEGTEEDYVILKIPYPVTRTILITNLATGEQGVSVQTKQINAGIIETSDKCGAYSVNNITGAITVKITGGPSCALIIEKRNSILMNIRFDMPLANFFEKGLQIPFITKIASILNIAATKIRIVMLYSGSTGVISAIDTQTQGDGSRASAVTELANARTALNSALSSNQMELDGENLTVLSADLEELFSTGDDPTQPTDPGTNPIDPTPTTPTTNAQVEEESSMIWLAIVIPIVVIILIGIPLVLWKLKKNRMKKYEMKRLPLPRIESNAP